MLPALAVATEIAAEVGSIATTIEIIIKIAPYLKDGAILVKDGLIIFSHEINDDFHEIVKFINEKL